MRIEVGGADALRDLARKLHSADRQLTQELHRGLRAAARDVGDAIEARSDDYMPAGYEKIFKASLHFKTEVRLAYDQRITVVVSAKGAQGHDRQVRQLEAGEFRAPNWGRWRKRRGINRGRHKLRNKWHTQRVRPHFATEPAQAAAPKVRDRIDAAVGRVIAKIERT